MNYTNMNKKLKASLVAAVALTLLSTPALAIVDLVAREGTWTPVGGSPITMWGFAADEGQTCGNLPPWTWTVGPEITEGVLQDNGNLRIRLRNCLSEPVSIMIPGQKAVVVGSRGREHPEPTRDGVRITSFTPSTPVDNIVDYLWFRVRQAGGTSLYMSGTHPAKQVHMGLYGALKVGTYENTSSDVTLLYSEIDPALHNPPTATTPLTYKPKYYLVNGMEEASIVAGDTSQPTVLSFLNAGLDFHVLALNKGYMSLLAEDGNPYPFAKEQYSVNLAAGKTIDAFWQPASDGEHVIFDRRGNNMMARLTVGLGVGASLAMPDSYATSEDVVLDVVVGIGLLFNDTYVAPAEVELDSGVSAGTLSCSDGGLLCADGSFSYLPNANFTGSDSFTYRIKASGTTPASNITTVTITVTGGNDPPVAVNDNYDAVTGVTLTIPAPGVLANDSDPDGDTLSVTSGGPIGANGSLTITDPTTQSFTYTVDDGNGGTSTATVTITVANDVPVAVDDVATVKRNSSVGTTDRGDPAGSDRNTFSLIANDTDANGINGATVVVSGTSQGGTVINNGDGTVSYTPVRRWRGTDTFTYTVMDSVGQISNTATVQVNVVRKRDLPPLPSL